MDNDTFATLLTGGVTLLCICIFLLGACRRDEKSLPPDERELGASDYVRSSSKKTRVHQNDPFYTDLRRRANDAGNAMALSFEAATAARRKGEHDLATNHRAAGVQRRNEMEELNAEASAWIFKREW